jgi:hypothetical protein
MEAGFVDLTKLTPGDRIVAGLGILEFLLLLFLPWHDVFGFDVKPLEGDGSAVAWPAVLAFIVLVALVAVVLVRRLAANVALPDLPIGWNQAIFYAAVAIPVLLLLKLVLKADYISFWAYVMIAVGIGIAYGGFLISKESDPAYGRGSTPPRPF